MKENNLLFLWLEINYFDKGQQDDKNKYLCSVN